MKKLTRRGIFILLTTLLFTTGSQAISLRQEKTNPALYENRSCEQLYHLATQLESHSLNYESSIYNQNNNNIASIVSTVFTPALYFLGYSNYMSFKSGINAYESNKELDKVRHRMAEMRCFY